MNKSAIVGREYEIRKLNDLYDSKTAGVYEKLINAFF